MRSSFVLRRAAALALLALSLGLLATTAQATKLRKQNLTELIAGAESIVSGTVKSVSDGIDAQGVPYTEVTLSVGRSPKGAIEAGKEYTFRQFGLLEPRTFPNGHQLLARAPEGFPTWHEGEYVVAFLNRPASRTGLQTTVGLAQGKLAQVNDRLANDFGNDGLFDGVQVSAGLLSPDENALLNGSPVDTAVFLNLIDRIVEQQWIEKGEMK
ncbi:hypothetical protein [Marilutibacter aestuarii]|uniref:Uncharacterized protein n=1 Tax=Marilutibacter aestuarii TaxID=1706195 RepID=A0A508ANH3_9GAMM|nr:hypothetical protein [Lysobacter aestuarii]TQD51027.1 hypothetical protein FKV25_02640 [Lysobacter aestuarii]